VTGLVVIFQNVLRCLIAKRMHSPATRSILCFEQRELGKIFVFCVSHDMICARAFHAFQPPLA
jgi:hypothetical protein